MRTLAQQTASQRALRNCSEEVRGEVRICVILVKQVRAVEHTVWQKVAAGHEEHLSPLVMLVLF